MTDHAPAQNAPEEDGARPDLDDLAGDHGDPTPKRITRSRKERYEAFRRRLVKDPRSFAVAKVLDEPIFAVYDGNGVTNRGGRLGVVGRFITSLHAMYESVEAAVAMTRLSFEQSVGVELHPIVPKAIRTRVEELVAASPERILDEDELRQVVPDSVVATAVVAELVASPAHVALADARAHGADTAEAYVRMARVVAEGAGTLKIVRASFDTAAMGSRRAQLVLQQLEERQELAPVILTVAGKLTRTDSEEKLFRVVLDRERMPPELDGRRRVIEGDYTPSAYGQVHDEGLWDRDVVARIRAWPMRDALHAKPLLHRFRFIDVRLAPYHRLTGG